MLSFMIRCTNISRAQLYKPSLYHNYATAAKSVPLKPKPLIKKPVNPRLPSAIPRPKEDLAKNIKVDVASNLFKSGHTQLYKAPHRLTQFRLQSWILSSVLAGGVLGWGSNKLLSFEEVKKRGLGTWIALTYWAVAVLFAGFAGLILSRTKGHIQSLDLISKAESVFLQVTVRSALPFRTRKIIVPPYDMLIDRKVVSMGGLPDWMVPERQMEVEQSKSVLKIPLNMISRFFYSIYSTGRQFFGQDGIINVTIEQNAADKSKTVKGYSMDIEGNYYEYNPDKKISRPALFDIVTVTEDDRLTI